jgi:polysaccharide export outer membrane protein
MFGSRNGKSPAMMILFGSLICLSLTGCMSRHFTAPPTEMPTERNKTTLPDHVIAPPDILLIDATTLVPLPPYHIKPLDALYIQVTVFGVKEEEKRAGLIPGQPIEGVYRVEPDGTVNLGFTYGSVVVVGQQVPAAKKAIEAHLKKRFKVDFDVTVTLAESRAMQQIRGEHLVRPDGKVTLGTYGSVYVTGLTLEQAKDAIQKHLKQFLLDPEISLDIAGFNSRVYYVVFNLDGAGQQVFRLPSTGNETVMDAVAELKGLPAGSYRRRMWVARPSLADATCNQILPVDWDAIVAGGSTATNYQLFPGDRVFVSVDPWIAADNWVAKVTAPFERVFGFTLLGTTTVRQFIGGAQQGQGSGFGGIP